MALDHSCQVQRHPLAERGHDLYETPDVAVEALLRVEKLPHRLWEPAAGRGAIVRVLRDAGHTVIPSDLIDYEFPLHTVGDFLKITAMPATDHWIGSVTTDGFLSTAAMETLDQSGPIARSF